MPRTQVCLEFEADDALVHVFDVLLSLVFLLLPSDPETSVGKRGGRKPQVILEQLDVRINCQRPLGFRT